MSSWCPCSNDSMPLMKQAYEKHKTIQSCFLWLACRTPDQSLKNLLKKWDVPFPAGYDKGDQIAKDYGVSSPPTTFFIDKTES